MAGDPGYLAKDVERYRSVTDRQVKKAAGKYLTTSSRVSLVIGPAGPGPEVK
jgi:zinc protease